MDTERLFDAIRSCWIAETSAEPENWTAANPAFGQCEVSSLIVLEYLGGDLDLHEVFRDGRHLEYHYSNRLPADDTVDLTIGQFRPGDEIQFLRTQAHEFIRANYPRLAPDLASRHRMLRSAVAARLGHQGDWLP